MAQVMPSTFSVTIVSPVVVAGAVVAEGAVLGALLVGAASCPQPAVNANSSAGAAQLRVARMAYLLGLMNEEPGDVYTGHDTVRTGEAVSRVQ